MFRGGKSGAIAGFIQVLQQIQKPQTHQRAGQQCPLQEADDSHHLSVGLWLVARARRPTVNTRSPCAPPDTACPADRGKDYTLISRLAMGKIWSLRRVSGEFEIG